MLPFARRQMANVLGEIAQPIRVHISRIPQMAQTTDAAILLLQTFLPALIGFGRNKYMHMHQTTE